MEKTLEELAMIAQEHHKKAQEIKAREPNNEEIKREILQRNIALTELITRIEQELYQYRRTDFSEDVYEQALQEVWLEICQQIERYDQNKGLVMGWALFKLKYKKIQVYNAITDNGRLGSIYKGNEETVHNILEIYQLPNINPLLSEQIVEVLKEDPEKLFEKKVFKNKPQANFKAIAIKRLEGISWKDIVQELQLGDTTGPISTFYQRCCEEFAPKFKEYLGL